MSAQLAAALALVAAVAIVVAVEVTVAVLGAIRSRRTERELQDMLAGRRMVDRIRRWTH